MVQIGKMNRLSINGIQEYGIHLDAGESGDILLREKNSAQKYQLHDKIDVFVYVDKEQRLMATKKKPYGMVGEFATLRVVTTTAVGAFLGWGLDDDLFVPKSEQQNNMKEGQSYVVFIFLSEKTNRITASSKLDKFLSLHAEEYREGQAVDLIVYAKTELGYNAIVNGSHVGIIYDNEIFQEITIGQQLTGFIKKLREDKKIDLRLQQTGYQRVDDVSQKILNIIQDSDGTVGVTDKSLPEEIYALFGVSKKVFKQAIGALYKKQLIIIDSDAIRIANPLENGEN